MGADGSGLWFNPEVWESSEAKAYSPPHDEEENYASAEPHLQDIHNKFMEEARPEVDRMRGPFSEAELKKRWGDKVSIAPFGDSP